MAAYVWRYAFFAALGFGLMALPVYQQDFLPSATHWLATWSGWLAWRPEVVSGIFLQAKPGGFSLEVVPDCLGMEVLVTFLAAVLAFPTGGRQRLLGVGIALAFLLLLNPLRIASLYHLGEWSYAWAVWVHDWAWDAVYFALKLAAFLFWASWARRTAVERTAVAAA